MEALLTEAFLTSLLFGAVTAGVPLLLAGLGERALLDRLGAEFLRRAVRKREPRAQLRAGFRVTDVEVIVRGVCASCDAAQPTT